MAALKDSSAPEPTLVFHDGIDLPHFAACDMLKGSSGVEHLKAYFEPYIFLLPSRACRREGCFVAVALKWVNSGGRRFARTKGYAMACLASGY